MRYLLSDLCGLERSGRETLLESDSIAGLSSESVWESQIRKGP